MNSHLSGKNFYVYDPSPRHGQSHSHYGKWYWLKRVLRKIPVNGPVRQIESGNKEQWRAEKAKKEEDRNEKSKVDSFWTQCIVLVPGLEHHM